MRHVTNDLKIHGIDSVVNDFLQREKKTPHNFSLLFPVEMSAKDKTQKTRVVLTLEERVKVIEKLDSGIPAYKIANELGVGKTQIQTIRLKKKEILRDYQSNVPSTSKRRKHTTGNEDINELTLTWAKDAISRRINVTGPLLQSKALEFAERLDKKDFKASKGNLFLSLSKEIF